MTSDELPILRVSASHVDPAEFKFKLAQSLLEGIRFDMFPGDRVQEARALYEATLRDLARMV